MTAGAGGVRRYYLPCKEDRVLGHVQARATKLGVEGGKLVIEKEGKIKKLVEAVEHVTFSGRRAVEQSQDVTYVTERCVMKLTAGGTRLSPKSRRGSMLRDVLAWSAFPLTIADTCKTCPAAIFSPDPIGLTLPIKPQRTMLMSDPRVA